MNVAIRTAFLQNIGLLVRFVNKLSFFFMSKWPKRDIADGKPII